MVVEESTTWLQGRVSVLKKIVACIIGLILSAAFGRLYAGNHEVIHPSSGRSIGWDNSEEIPYWLDLGPMGTLTNLQARILVESMMDVWTSVDTARVNFSYKGDLAEDVTEENIADYLAMTSCGSSDRSDIPENVVPVIFDSDGKIIEYLVGKGSSVEVGGISTLRCFLGDLANPKSIYQGMVIFNGQFIDGLGPSNESPTDLSVNSIAGVILHELGHLIGLDHTALNEDVYYNISTGTLSADYSKYLPVMLPTVLRRSNSSTTIHPDDIAAISTLYPSPGYLSGAGELRGEVLKSNGKEVRKANIIARREDDPLCEAYASVSGRRCTPLLDADGNMNFNGAYCGSSDLYGDYSIEGLPPGSYTVEVEELDAGWIRSGMYPLGLDNDLPGDAEFYNDGDGVDEPPYTFSLVDVGADEIVLGVDIVLNESSAKSGQLARIPLNKFQNGPGIRCLPDQADYAAVISDAGDGPNLSVFQDMTADLDAEPGSGSGGCQINGSVGYAGWELALLVFLLTAVIIRRGYLCV